MNEIYTLHKNVPYEFGAVVGLFATKDAAIAHAMTLDTSDELTVERWTPSDDPEQWGGREVWGMYGGKVVIPA